MFERHLFDGMPLGPATPMAECRINELPRDLLLRILSHSRMGARQVVRTCVLSRLWRDLWRDVPRINASRHEFGAEADGSYEERNPLFKKFVNRLLMLRNPVALDEFRLCLNITEELDADCAEANLWIGRALLCNAQFVEVSAFHDRLELGPAVFTSKHLRSLRFDNVILMHGFFGQLQTGCKVLERLILQKCAIDDIEISSQTLKVLSIGTDCFFGSFDRASISIPSLIHLGFFGHNDYNRIPLLTNMESLETAYISVGSFWTALQVYDIRQFLEGLSGVTKLDFYFLDSELEVAKNLQWCSRFNNLTVLTLGGWCLHDDFYALIVFLQNSPNLAKLTLNLVKHFYARGRIAGELEERSFTCEHLKVVEIICTERDAVVDSLEKFLLDSGVTSGQIHIKH